MESKKYTCNINLDKCIKEGNKDTFSTRNICKKCYYLQRKKDNIDKSLSNYNNVIKPTRLKNNTKKYLEGIVDTYKNNDKMDVNECISYLKTLKKIINTHLLEHTKNK